MCICFRTKVFGSSLRHPGGAEGHAPGASDSRPAADGEGSESLVRRELRASVYHNVCLDIRGISIYKHIYIVTTYKITSSIL